MKYIFQTLAIITAILGIVSTIPFAILGLPILLKCNKKVYLSYLLSTLARMILVFTAPITRLYSLLTMTSEQYEKYNFNNALAYDQTGNSVLSSLLNACFIKKGGALYGNRDETISSCTGKNKVFGKLTKAGTIFDNILSFFEKNHSIKAIDTTTTDKYKN